MARDSKDPDYPHYPEDPVELARALFAAGDLKKKDDHNSKRPADDAAEAVEAVDPPTGADISPSPVFGDSGD